MSSYDISMVMFAFEYTNLYHNIISTFGNYPGEWYRSHACWSGCDPNPYKPLQKTSALWTNKLNWKWP